MENKYRYLTNLSQLILNLLLILSALSVIFYSMGYLNNFFYYTTLGLDGNFVDYQYINTLYSGLLYNIIFLFLTVPYLVIFYLDIHRLNSLKAKLFNNIRNTENTNEEKQLKDFKAQNANLENTINKLEETVSRDPWRKNRFLSNLIFAILSYFLATLFFFITRNYSSGWIFAFCGSVVLFPFISIFLIHDTEKGKKTMLKINQYVITFTLILLLLCVSNVLVGFIRAQIQLNTPSTNLYNVRTIGGETIYSVSLIYFGNNNYIFLQNSKLEIVPSNQITSLSKELKIEY